MALRRGGSRFLLKDMLTEAIEVGTFDAQSSFFPTYFAVSVPFRNGRIMHREWFGAVRQTRG